MCPRVSDLCNTRFLFCINTTLASLSYPQLSLVKRAGILFISLFTTLPMGNQFLPYFMTPVPWEAPPPTPSQPPADLYLVQWFLGHVGRVGCNWHYLETFLTVVTRGGGGGGWMLLAPHG